MAIKSSSSDVSAPNSDLKPISDDDLIRGFILALGAGGRKARTLFIYEDSIRKFSDFARELGLSGLATMDRVVVRRWLSSLHQQGNKPATVSIRYRSLNRFFRWCRDEEERADNPMDHVDPPKVHSEIQAYYLPDGVEPVVKSIGCSTPHNLRDAAMVMVLYDTGVRAAEVCGMQIEDLDRRDHTIIVTGKASKQRRVSIGGKSAMAIERYLRKRGSRNRSAISRSARIGSEPKEIIVTFGALSSIGTDSGSRTSISSASGLS